MSSKESNESLSSTGQGLISVIIVSEIVRSANVVVFRVGDGGGVGDLLSQNFRYKIKPTIMQNETAQIASMIIMTRIGFDIFDDLVIFGFDSA
jgi:hypothetical protein